jgi:hypothetical protein
LGDALTTHVSTIKVLSAEPATRWVTAIAESVMEIDLGFFLIRE